MSTPKDRLEAPYKATSSETVDLLTGVAQRMVNSDGPLLAWSQVADVTANGASKYARGDWRTRSQEYFLPKILRHLRKHFGHDAYYYATDSVVDLEWIAEDEPGYIQQEPEAIDAESGQPHLARAATNILMCLENCGNREDAPAIEPVTAEKLGMVYLAMPYTVNPELSCVMAREIVESCVKDGVAVYAPTLYGHTAAKDGSYDYWLAHGLKMLAGCDSLVLVQSEELGPWQCSAGCAKEFQAARASGKLVYDFYYDTKQIVLRP